MENNLEIMLKNDLQVLSVIIVMQHEVGDYLRFRVP
jgi:hypothetical protein